MSGLTKDQREELLTWRRARRYGVRPAMIAEATARRLAGDWFGACAAARIEVSPDVARVYRHGFAEEFLAAERWADTYEESLAGVRARIPARPDWAAARRLGAVDEDYVPPPDGNAGDRSVQGWTGVESAALLRADLRALVPDLLRWHLPHDMGHPSIGWSEFSRRSVVTLTEYGHRGDYLRLVVRLPADRLRFLEQASWQVDLTRLPRLELVRDSRATPDHMPRLAREFWHNGHTDGLRLWCGDAERTAFFRRDGSRSGPVTGPVQPGSAAELEVAVERWERGEPAEALAPYGVDAVDIKPHWNGFPVAPHRIGPPMRELREVDWAVLRYGAGGLGIQVLVADGRVTMGARGERGSHVQLPDSEWRRLPDWDLLRHGLVEPDELHPLVRRALLPDAPERPQWTMPDPEPAAVQVPCSGGSHRIEPAGGTLRLADHTAEELAREATLVALGAAAQGCLSVRQAWYSGTGALPGPLWTVREHLFLRMFHGDAAGVRALLDAGWDPLARAPGGLTLLHLLPHLDDHDLLPRLLDAGLDVHARDDAGYTALETAEAFRCERLADALRAAG
ncbi:hypothetical protein Val02_76130 [Virgisporangium aliadipatigenens]|uniref:Ankyrin repeat domain-containing protein n=1 Tax=Virgisporangium aliadipatigenens TaxID=741659 RepID=A0A8J4DW25_9ACTN|nr:hypothetical protein [Virgisporangium aliadipatigenens]GIJ50727.1 hypothetical protein Val02_76130 [Virgisporangium aliadipatigenens]